MLSLGIVLLGRNVDVILHFWRELRTESTHLWALTLKKRRARAAGGAERHNVRAKGPASPFIYLTKDLGQGLWSSWAPSLKKSIQQFIWHMISRMRVIRQLCKTLGKRDKCGCVLSSEIGVTYSETGIKECYLGRDQDGTGSIWKSSHFFFFFFV